MSKFIIAIFGKLSWTAPGWLLAYWYSKKTRPAVFWGLPLSILLFAGILYYYHSLPTPFMLEAKIYAPTATDDSENAKPNKLVLAFYYDESLLDAGEKLPPHASSPARIELLDKEIKQGVSLSPSLEGEWRWDNDNQLIFTPQAEWQPGTDYTVRLQQDIFAPGIKLATKTYAFSSAEFTATISALDFYQDPTDASIRKVVSTLDFTYPVSQESLKKAITLAMRPSDSSISAPPKAFNYSLELSNTGRTAWLHSEPVALPKNTNYMTLSLAEGLRSALGGSGLSAEVTDRVVIPDIGSYLQMDESQALIVRNSENVPEQVVYLHFTDEIHEQEIADKLKIYLLPKTYKKQKRHWSSVAQVDNNVLAASKRVQLKAIPNERARATSYSWVIDVEEDRSLYIQIEKGLSSVNKFVKSSTIDALLKAPQYPKEINITGDGSVLSFSGSHKLSVLSRGVPALQYNIGRLLDNQINHLISQSYGDVSNPGFNSYNFNEQNLAEFQREIVNLKNLHPRDANYSSVDLSNYLPTEKDRFGLFFVDIQGWDPKRKESIYGVTAKRLVLLTDIGIIVKSNADESHELFLQSVRSGKAIANAEISLLGKNGLPIQSKTSDSRGHASFPAIPNIYSLKEKQPVVYVVRSGSDISYIPYQRSNRQVQLSRFDVGGEQDWNAGSNNLKAYVFSDRGIYRPGEKVNLGFIVKNSDLSNVEGIPLEWAIRGPQGNEVASNRVTLDKYGFMDVQFQTELTSDTGNYYAAIYLVNHDRRYSEIGSTSLKVEEFQPDTMKIQSRLVDTPLNGWSNAKEIQAEVKLENLFGLAAQDRKTTARLRVVPATFLFSEYKDFTFNDPFRDQDAAKLNIQEELEELHTNEAGIALYNIDLSRFSGGTYRLSFSVEGFDQSGGRSVKAANSLLISPMQTLVGIKANGALDFIHLNSERHVDLIAIDQTLQKIEYADLRLRKTELQTVSTLIKQANGTYQYQSVEREKEMSTESYKIEKSGSNLSLDTSAPGDYALEVINPKNQTIARIKYSVVGHGNMIGKLDKNAELELKLNKKDFQAGEKIELNIRAPYIGAGLITIETNKVESFKWFTASEQSTMQTITIPENLEGGAYVHVALMRDVNSKAIFSSPFSYAVEHFSIDKSAREIDIQLNAPAITKPGEVLPITYSASKNARIAIFAIDEGILQVAKYQLPKPLQYYLKKKALGVTTYQILDLILPEFEVLQMLSAAGGDAMYEMADSRSAKMRALLGKNLNPFQRKLDAPAVYWSGIVDAGNENKTLDFTVPDTFSGALRLMAVAVSDKAMGSAETDAIVRGPFVISPNVLTSTVPGDEFQVTAGISNILEGSGKNAKVKLELTVAEHFEIIGPSTVDLNIDEGSEAKVTFNLRTLNKLGAAELIFKASHENQSLIRKASLSVRPTSAYTNTFTAAQAKNASTGLDVERKLYPELAQNSISASTSPLVIVDGLKDYLEHFPHGCTEQVVSQVFPLVGLMSHPAYGPHIEKVQSHFDHLIIKLSERQNNEGGFYFWPGGDTVAAYPSVYVNHFLVDARDAGFQIPGPMWNRGRDWMQYMVQSQPTNMFEARVRANAIYLLTRMGIVTTNSLVDLQEYLEANFKDSWQQDLAAAYMAASYQLLKNTKDATRLIDNYKLSYAKRERYNDFDSLLTQDAQYIYLLAKHFPDKAKSLNRELILGLSKVIFKGEYNTIAASYTVLALGAYSKLVLQDDAVDEPEFIAVLEDASEHSLAAVFKPFATATYPVNTKELKLKGSNNGLFYLNIQSGYDRETPQQAIREGLEIFRTFHDEQGKEITSFTQGKEITVKLKLRTLTGEPASNIAVVDLLPGGFEILRDSVSREQNYWRGDYIDIREDRIVFYGGFDANIRELSYKVKLTASGTFTVPPSHAESMYDRSMHASSVASKFTVAPSL